MPQLKIDPRRFDPYRHLKFRVKWDGHYIVGVTRISGLRRTIEVVAHREGGDPNVSRPSPGRISFEPITLQRGITHDSSFEDWANLVSDLGPALEPGPTTFRKDIVIELYNKAGQIVLAFKVHRCWVSEWQPLSALDTNTAQIALQSITLQHEGWERDTSIPEPRKVPRLSKPRRPSIR
jgi:phage tail-like protein